jgi:hypothetical protein
VDALRGMKPPLKLYFKIPAAEEPDKEPETEQPSEPVEVTVPAEEPDKEPETEQPSEPVEVTVPAEEPDKEPETEQPSEPVKVTVPAEEPDKEPETEQPSEPVTDAEELPEPVQGKGRLETFLGTLRAKLLTIGTPYLVTTLCITVGIVIIAIIIKYSSNTC